VKAYFEILSGVQAKIPTQGQQRTLICTRGAREVVVNQAGKNQAYLVPNLDKSQIKDSNGAGDSFVGGFLSQIALDKSLDSAVNAGMFCSMQVL